VQTCQEDDDDAVVLSSEERQKVLEAKQSQICQIVGKCSGAVHKMLLGRSTQASSCCAGMQRQHAINVSFPDTVSNSIIGVDVASITFAHALAQSIIVYGLSFPAEGTVDTVAWSVVASLSTDWWGHSND
jgi:hypothetical protein